MYGENPLSSEFYLYPELENSNYIYKLYSIVLRRETSLDD